MAREFLLEYDGNEWNVWDEPVEPQPRPPKETHIKVIEYSAWKEERHFHEQYYKKVVEKGDKLIAAIAALKKECHCKDGYDGYICNPCKTIRKLA